MKTKVTKTIIDANIIAASQFPADVLSDTELKLYLYMCSCANEFGEVDNTYNGYCYFIEDISEDDFAESIDHLNNLKIIRLWQDNSILYLRNLPYKCCDGFFTMYDVPHCSSMFDEYEINTVKIPTETLYEALKLGHSELLTLLKLYQICDYELFEGADPNLIRIENGAYIIHPRLQMDLGATTELICTAIRNLINAGFVTSEEKEVYIEDFDREYRLRLMTDEVSCEDRPKLIEIVVPNMEDFR